MDPDDYCQNKAAPAGSTLYYSFRFLPAARRRAATAVYAFYREVDEIRIECREASVARIKLQWWRDEVGRLFKGEPRHPVTRALLEPVRTFSLPMEHFLEIIDGAEMDVGNFSYPSFKDLMLYCHRLSSMTAMMAAEVFGYRDRHTLKYAHDLGTAAKLTSIIRRVRQDGALGHIYLPLDELARFRVAAEDLLAGRDTDDVRQLIKYQIQRARDFYRTALERLPETDRWPQRGGIITAELQQAVLREIEADGYHVLAKRIALTPLRKLWIAWKVTRRERRRMRSRRE